MVINKKMLTIFAITTMLFSSCQKKGCIDKNADNFDEDAKKSKGNCTYRYVSGIQVTAPTDGGFDLVDGPDVYVKFKRTASSTFYQSSQVNDSYTATLTVPSDIMFTNESWDYELYDSDAPDADDLIASGSFNPLTSGSSGSIPLSVSGINTTFLYTVK